MSVTIRIKCQECTEHHTSIVVKGIKNAVKRSTAKMEAKLIWL